MSFDREAFGRRVASAREWAGLAPKQLAEQLDVNVEAIYRLERGARKTPPRRGELRLLAEVLGQSEEWLLGSGEDAPPWSGPTTAQASENVLAAIEGLRRDMLERFDRLERQVRDRRP